MKRLRPEIHDFKQYSPGMSIGEIKEKYGLDSIIKMASNENPLGVSPRVQEVLCANAEQAYRYPRSGCPDLIKVIADYHDLDASCIVAGNGSDELIDLLLRAVAVPGVDNVVACKPCFSIYELQSRLCGVEFRQAALNPDFTFPWTELRRLVDERTAVVFITTPDNPSGYAPPVEELLEMSRSLPKTSLLVVDEAYMDFTDDHDQFSILQYFRPSSNIVVLRTFSKMFGLAGLRLGYGIMPEWLAEALQRIKLPFSVNLLAEVAGIAALEDHEFSRQTLQTVREGRSYLSEKLKRLRCFVFPSQANFILFRPPQPAEKVFSDLLSRGIIIRHAGSYGLEECLRVSIGNQDENKRFILALEELL
ncbi:MAG: histidinol-phosphate transaminase [Desulfovibrionales bacterium]